MKTDDGDSKQAFSENKNRLFIYLWASLFLLTEVYRIAPTVTMAKSASKSLYNAFKNIIPGDLR